MLRVRTFKYNVNEGLLQSNIIDAACDNYNQLWLSFSNGIQRFNGFSFEQIPVQQGLPDDKFTRFILANNELFIFHSKGISRFEEQTNSMEMVYREDLPLSKLELNILGEWEEQLYFMTHTHIYSFHTKNFTVQSRPLPHWYQHIRKENLTGGRFSNIQSGMIFINNQRAWVLASLKNFKPLLSGEFSEPMDNTWKPFLKTDTTIVLASTSKGKKQWRIWSPVKRKFIYSSDLQLKSGKIFCNRLGDWNQHHVMQIDDLLLEVNENLEIEKQYLNYNSKTVTDGLHFISMVADHLGNKYLISITGGFIMIPSYNLQLYYYHHEKRIDHNIVSIAINEKNANLVTAGKGLTVYDTNQQVLYSLDQILGQPGFFATQVVVAPDGGYLFTTFAPFRIWQCDASLKHVKQLKPVYHTKEMYSNYFTETVANNANEAILAQENSLIKINWKTNRAAYYSYPTIGYTMSALLVDSLIWIHSSDSMYFINSKTLKLIGSRYFPNTGNVRCYQKLNDGNIAIGTNKGIFIVNKQVDIVKIIDKSEGLPDECIYSIEEDKDGNLWCSSNKGIFKVSDNGIIVQFNKEDGLQENEFNTNVSVTASHGEMYFGGVNGVNSFYPWQIQSDTDTPSMRLVSIKINNEPSYLHQSTFELKEIVLPYYKNNLSLDFIAMGKRHASQYIYQYRISKLDKNWQVFQPGQSLRFLLPPGKYQLELFASRSFQQNARPLKIIRMEILPPFWKTIWFLSLLAIGFIAIVVFAASAFIKRNTQQQKRKLEAEQKITEERERISRDLHDNIGAYANALLYNAELVEAQSNMPQRERYIKDIKFAAKDIITSLRETVWALKNETYSAEETFIRLKNYLHALRSYYPQIKFQLSGEAPPGLVLQNQESLNIIRIIQEAITNAIKHSNAETITLKSEWNSNEQWIMITEDNGKGFDFEHEKKYSTGNGLNNMQYRANKTSLQLEVTTNKNGTIIKISYPLSKRIIEKKS